MLLLSAAWRRLAGSLRLEDSYNVIISEHYSLVIFEYYNVIISEHYNLVIFEYYNVIISEQ